MNAYLKALFEREKIIFLAIFLSPVLIISLMFIFMVPAQSAKIRRLQDELILQKGMSGLKSALEKSSLAIKAFKSSVYRQDQLNMLLKDIESEALKNDLYVAAIAPKPFYQDISKGYKMAEIELKLKGNYHDFARFLNNLENRHSALSVNSMNILSSPDGSDINKMELVLGVFLAEENGER